ncbi:eukaryotic aspartyl protease, partial [Teladorsagia circumcincta]
NEIFQFGGEDEDQLAVPDTTFGLATHISSDFRSDPTDGILGLAFTSLAENNVVPPLINAIRQNLLDEPIFTVWMAHRGAEEGVHGGMFTYGGFDKENCGPIIAYEPLTSATYFQFRMKGIGAGEYKSKIPYEVISDTGTSFIGGPKSITDKLARAVGAKFVADEDSYVIPCNAKPPTLDIYIGSHKYPIEPVNYIVSAGEDVCLFAVFPMESGGFGPTWILGDPFIRQYCNVHDMGKQRMAFAKSLQK